MIELHVFGRPQLTKDGISVELKPKSMALLVYLALAKPRGAYQKSALIAIFNPAKQETKKDLFQTLIDELIDAFGREDIIGLTGDEVELDLSNVDCDAVAFDGAIAEKQLETAASLYNGALLEGVNFDDCPALQNWLDGERRTRERYYAHAVEQLAAVAAREGNHGRSAYWLQKLAHVQPHNGRVAILLMNALQAAGDRADAIRAGERHVECLRGDLNAQPEPKVLEVLDQLRSTPRGMVDTPILSPSSARSDVADTFEEAKAALASDYRLLAELGMGGMSSVYLAEDLKHGRKVAVKVLNPDIAAIMGPERFLREIEIAADLSHPYIVTLIDSGASGGFLYYVMPYIQGESLREKLQREKQLDIDEAIQITQQVASALDYSHRNGVIHRDIKPENILLHEGEAMVADFGIALALSKAGRGRITQTRFSLGTPEYMSPEQASGQLELDGRSDIYSLGCVLYELLGGSPPFVGGTPQAILTRHLTELPQQLEVVRSDVPPSVLVAVHIALEKTPADRFGTASEFSDALSESEQIYREPEPDEPKAPSPRAWAAPVLAVIAVSIWLILGRGTDALAANRVVVFPLVATEPELNQAGEGWNVALTIEAALEHTRPLKWIDGWSQLNEELRVQPHLVTSDVAEAISRDRGARYYIDGAIRVSDDTLAVQLRLYDVAGDSLVAQETAAGYRNESNIEQLGLYAITRLLPKLLEPAREVDLSPLTDRHPGAVALLIQGDREYRRSRFSAALGFYRRAVQEDSLLAFAAIKGAQAATWKNRSQEAAQFIDLALRHEQLLPSKYQRFAAGLQMYLGGQADSAVTAFQGVLEIDSTWSEALMALGETYYHLFPTAGSLDSLAEAFFTASWVRDTAFAPPLVHLTQIALRRGEVERGDSLHRELSLVEPDTAYLRRQRLMLDCVREGPDATNWAEETGQDPTMVFAAARDLAATAMQSACAKAGFRALFDSPSAPSGHKWAALLGLQGLLMAEGKYEDVADLLDAALAMGISAAHSIYVFDALIGAPFDAQGEAAERFAREAAGELYEGGRPESRWLFALWHAQKGDTIKLNRLYASMMSAASETESRRDRLLADALAPRIALALGDTTTAVSLLRALKPTAPRNTLSWEQAEPLPMEKNLLAELLLAIGEYEEAFQVASIFDHQEPVMFLPFLRNSLTIRMRAAYAMRRDRLAQALQERLNSLGWVDSPDAGS